LNWEAGRQEPPEQAVAYETTIGFDVFMYCPLAID